LPGVVLLFSFTGPYKDRNFYRRTFLKVVGLAAVAEFYVNLADFHLIVELLLLPALFLLAAMSAVAGLKPETRPAKRFVDAVLGVVWIAILVGTGVWIVDHWDTLDQGELVLTFALPIWLTLIALPFVGVLSLYANYETTFVRIDHFTQDDREARRRAKVALIASFHVRNRALAAFTGRAAMELVRATTWDEARRIIAYHAAEARVREATEDLQAKRLARFAGIAGTDDEGHPLDQREFRATKSALAMLPLSRRSDGSGRRRTVVDRAPRPRHRDDGQGRWTSLVRLAAHCRWLEPRDRR
jgi:hypothetical protein